MTTINATKQKKFKPIEFKCICGSTTDLSHKSRHFKTKKHKQFIQKMNYELLEKEIEEFLKKYYPINYVYYFEDELKELQRIKREKEKKDKEKWKQILNYPTRRQDEIFESDYDKYEYQFYKRNKSRYYCGEQ